MSNAEGLSPEERIEEISKELSPGHQQFVEDQIDNEWGYLISDIAKKYAEHKLQQVTDEVQGRAMEPDNTDATIYYNGAIQDVLQIINRIEG